MANANEDVAMPLERASDHDHVVENQLNLLENQLEDQSNIECITQTALVLLGLATQNDFKDLFITDETIARLEKMMQSLIARDFLDPCSKILCVLGCCAQDKSGYDKVRIPFKRGLGNLISCGRDTLVSDITDFLITNNAEVCKLIFPCILASKTLKKNLIESHDVEKKNAWIAIIKKMVDFGITKSNVDNIYTMAAYLGILIEHNLDLDILETRTFFQQIIEGFYNVPCVASYCQHSRLLRLTQYIDKDIFDNFSPEIGREKFKFVLRLMIQCVHTADYSQYVKIFMEILSRLSNPLNKYKLSGDELCDLVPDTFFQKIETNVLIDQRYSIDDIDEQFYLFLYLPPYLRHNSALKIFDALGEILRGENFNDHLKSWLPHILNFFDQYKDLEPVQNQIELFSKNHMALYLRICIEKNFHKRRNDNLEMILPSFQKKIESFYHDLKPSSSAYRVTKFIPKYCLRIL